MLSSVLDRSVRSVRGVQWVSLLCVVNGWRLFEKFDCPIKSVLLVWAGFGFVMPPLLGLSAGKGAEF